MHSTIGRLALLTIILGATLSRPASAVTIVDFGTSPAGPITNNVGVSGDFAGTEYGSLGVFFAAGPTDVLNIGCGQGAGNTGNCLGADDGATEDFSGVVFVTFSLGGIAQTTALVDIDYVNPALPPTRTIIRDINGNVLLDQAAGDVFFAAPGIASVEWYLTFDGADTFTFGDLTATAAVPEPGTTVALGSALLVLASMARRRRSRQAVLAAAVRPVQVQ